MAYAAPSAIRLLKARCHIAPGRSAQPKKPIATRSGKASSVTSMQLRRRLKVVRPICLFGTSTISESRLSNFLPVFRFVGLRSSLIRTHMLKAALGDGSGHSSRGGTDRDVGTRRGHLSKKRSKASCRGPRRSRPSSWQRRGHRNTPRACWIGPSRSRTLWRRHRRPRPNGCSSVEEAPRSVSESTLIRD